MMHFTIVHTITLIILFIIFGLLCFVSFKTVEKKLFIPIVLTNFIAISMLAVFAMIALDKYTKKARIENFTQKRILRNETIVFRGIIRNIGKFTIGKCVLEIKLVNNPVSSKKLGSGDVFKPTSGLNFLKKDGKSSTVKEEFVIARDLKAKKFKTFTLTMAFPPYFSKASEYHYLSCH